MQVSTAKMLVDKPNQIFYEKKSRVIFKEDLDLPLDSRYRIDSLIQHLRKGPLVAAGILGPAYYEDAPFKLKNQQAGYDIYGWKPGAKRLESSELAYVIILGVTKLESNGLIYFIPSVDITNNDAVIVRELAASTSDSKIYVVSHKTFEECLVDLYPSYTESDEKVASSKDSVKDTEQAFVARLSELPLKSILDRGEGEAKCKAIGQEIFDKFKKEANEDSEVGFEALQTIIQKVKTSAQDGKVRFGHIERAWDGVGDAVRRWHH